MTSAHCPSSCFNAQADIFAGTAYGQPALTKAAENGHCEASRGLISHIMEVYALYICCKSTQVIEHLTSRGADLEHRDVAGFAPKKIQGRKEGRENCNPAFYARCTPLQAAASRNHLGAVQLLLAEGACVNPLPGSPGSALCSAAQFAGVEVRAASPFSGHFHVVSPFITFSLYWSY
eukprot:318395-Pelagomonas_calceolata.AAC.11